MAFTDYTPNDTFHPTISLPDDAQMRLNGIGAFNTPLQQLADNTAFNAKGRLEYDPAWLLKSGQPVPPSLAPVPPTDRLQHGDNRRRLTNQGADMTLQVHGCMAFDTLLVTASLLGWAANFPPTFFLCAQHSVSPSVSSTLATLVPILDNRANNAEPFTATLTGQWTLPVGGSVSIYIEWQLWNPGADYCEIEVIGEVIIQAFRLRPVISTEV